ncbi:hypothetical protein O181_042990 [Austropuccinia psidii MF-1]|uniref:Peptidase M48 domain-containing protein n=1 Tax=Austropuccinia psidii MF-1 TaxID=1389203 RepID=A0A9Q3HIQ6_9BASI|nr:hypothetical protein [Austropuccinia psidii MF-1]
MYFKIFGLDNLSKFIPRARQESLEVVIFDPKEAICTHQAAQSFRIYPGFLHPGQSQGCVGGVAAFVGQRGSISSLRLRLGLTQMAGCPLRRPLFSAVVFPRQRPSPFNLGSRSRLVARPALHVLPFVKTSLDHQQALSSSANPYFSTPAPSATHASGKHYRQSLGCGLPCLLNSSAPASCRRWNACDGLFSKILSPRTFHSTSPRKDLFGFGVFSCSMPMLKSFLLSLTRITFIILPFWYRWRLARHFPRASRTLLVVPLFAICLVIAIGIDQSPTTHRWRLLLMSEGEELEWSQRRFKDFLAADGQFVLSSDDPRTQLVKKVCDRLMAVLDLDTPVSAVACPRNHNQIKEQIRQVEVQIGVLPSETAGSCLMPWKPLSNNPEKILQGHDWDLFVVDSPQINAFALPTKEIVIYTGLLNLLGQKEDLTAAIISHEISHVLERHAVENMGFSALSAVLFDAVRGISFALTISFPLLSDTLATCINYLSDLVAEKAYNKKLEFEADELGLRILTRAGYDPGGVGSNVE